MITTVLAICGLLAVIVYATSFKPSPLLQIPGPQLTPIIGNVLHLDPVKPFMSLNDMSKKYGSIFKLKLFSKFIVVVNDYDSIHHVLVKKSSHFDGRPTSYRFSFLSKNMDIASIDAGPEVKGRRKAIQKYLKQFGSEVEKIEAIINDAVEELINKLEESKGKPIEIQEELFEVLTDLVAVLLNGSKRNDCDLREIMNGLMAIVESLKASVSGQMLDIFPILRYFGNETYNLMERVNRMKTKYMTQWIDSNPDIGFINHVLRMSDEEKQNAHLYDLEAQIHLFFQFFVAGTLTTSTTLSCLINILCQNPSIQSKLQKEVETHVGLSRSPKISDKNQMPYHRATLLEAGRFLSISPFSIPHKTTQSTKINGYTIPKNTEVWPNLWTLHHDDKFWDEPFRFKPERYLDENGDLVPVDHPNRKHTMPFGAGNRVCVGEIFAQNRMFMFLASWMQHFTILPETDLHEQPSCDPRDMLFGFINTSPPFKVRFQNLH